MSESLANSTLHTRPRASRVLLALAVLGVLWNLFGIVQFFDTLQATPRGLMAAGLDAAAAEIYLGLPAWMDVAFAIGVFGGLLGSIALGARHPWALPLLSLSLAAYVALFLGDLSHGMFSAIPGQLGVLLLVLLIAIVLFAAAVITRRRSR